MNKWVTILLLNLAAMPSVAASMIEFSYTRNFVSFGTGSFEYDHTNPDSPVSNYELDGIFWDSVQYTSFISNDNKIISIRATKANSFAILLLSALDVNFPSYPETLSLDSFESGSIVIGSALNPSAPVYSITSLGEPAVVPLPASLWLFASGFLVLAFRNIIKPCK